jgi:hypothetical protein
MAFTQISSIGSLLQHALAKPKPTRMSLIAPRWEEWKKRTMSLTALSCNPMSSGTYTVRLEDTFEKGPRFSSFNTQLLSMYWSCPPTLSGSLLLSPPSLAEIFSSLSLALTPPHSRTASQVDRREPKASTNQYFTWFCRQCRQHEEPLEHMKPSPQRASDDSQTLYRHPPSSSYVRVKNKESFRSQQQPRLRPYSQSQSPANWPEHQTRGAFES